MEIEEETIPLHKPVAERIYPWHIIYVLILVFSAIAFQSWAGAVDGLVRIHVLDIGQGDAILILTEDGRQVLIDGGPDGTILSKLGEYLPSWDRDIDMVIASHKHSDHIAGLVAVLDRYEVDHIVQGFESTNTAIGRAWDAAVADEGAIVTEGVEGTIINLGASISLSVLFPYDSRQGTVTSDANNESLVIMLQHEQVKMLLTGDAEQPVERRLIMDEVDVDADILKVGHHGSKTSTTPEFLSAVTPQAAIISVGHNNRYRHPHPVVLSILESFHVPYYRTDVSGDITITSDGENFSISGQHE